MEHNCSFGNEQLKFRYRSAGVIIENNCVLMVTNDNADYYYSIGGRVHIGESAEEDVKCEVFEGTGIQLKLRGTRELYSNSYTQVLKKICTG